jgi:hypothetical protein
MTQPLHSLGLHAHEIARHCRNERMQTILQWVGVGSVIMMGAAATIHLFKDLFHSVPAPKHRQMLDDLETHYRKNDKERGR